MILNIHGLDGSCKNTNYGELVKLFGEDRIISLQLNYRMHNTESILHILEHLADDAEFIVGKSLGGFFAAYLSASKKIPCILVNPCLRMDLYIDGLMEGYFEENGTLIEQMMKEIRESAYLSEHAHMILGESDELLAPEDARAFLPESDIVMLPGGHDLEGEEFSRVFGNMIDKLEMEKE